VDKRLTECKYCGKLFFVSKNAGAVRFCSEKCREAWNRLLRKNSRKKRKTIFKVCPICGTIFVQYDSRRKFKYCSSKCAREAKKIQNRLYARRKSRWREYQKPLSNLSFKK